MKRFVSLLATGALLVGLCGCSMTSDFIRDNVSNEVADAFDQAVDQAMDQGSQLMNAAGAKLKEQLANQMEGVSNEVRSAISEKIDQLSDVDTNTAIFTTIPNQDGNQVAILANYPEAKLVATLTEYPIGTYIPNPDNATPSDFTMNIDGKTVAMGSMQCLAYARYVQHKLYKEHDSKSGGNFVNILPEAIGADSVPAGTLSAETLKTAVTAAGPGAHLRTLGKQHSIFIAEVTEDGFVALEANHDGDMLIRKIEYTWDSYLTNTFGSRGIAYINVYRPQ